MGIFIGLTGLNASGKGEAVSLLIQLGFRSHSLSDVVRGEATLLGRDHSRDNLIEIGNRLRSSEGFGVLARRILPTLKDKDVIDSIRHPEEVAVLRELDRFLLLGIDAPIELRFERSRLRGRGGDATTLEAFRRMEERELGGPESESQQLLECLRLADTRIRNDATRTVFHQRIRESLRLAGFRFRK
ncbi:MAG: hypothetical protein O6947_08715 [Acidobacteria bacterium]|nr:hypothetical protein [Acidobacteriota bacterium]